jgi:hypothetical protein
MYASLTKCAAASQVAMANPILARRRQSVSGSPPRRVNSIGSLPATAGKLGLLDDVLNKRQLNPRRALSFIEQELAHFSNGQRFVYYEHVMVSVVQFDDSRVLHA